MPIKDYSTSAAANTALFPENMNPGAVNDGARQVQADVRAFYETMEWRDLGDIPTYVSGTSFTLAGDKTEQYVAGRRIKLSHPINDDVYATIATSNHSAGTTTITYSVDSGTVDSTVDVVSLGVDPANKPVSIDSVYGVSTFSKTFLDDDDDDAVRTTLGIPTAISDAIDAIPDVPTPTRQYLLSGTTYTTPSNARKLIVKMVGGGGGGGGSGGSGGNGGDTSFNSIVAKGGTGGGGGSSAPGAGGTGGAGTADFRQAGGTGVSQLTLAGKGGDSRLGYGGATNIFAGSDADPNTGGGGGGGGSGIHTASGAGPGGGGEYVELIISSPAESYTYAIGAGGTAGTGTNSGGAGGSGLIIVEEYY